MHGLLSRDLSDYTHDVPSSWAPFSFVTAVLVVAIVSRVSPEFVLELSANLPGVHRANSHLERVRPETMVCAVGVLGKARSAVEDERECVRAERDAFQQFAREIRALDVPAQSTMDASPGLVMKTNAGGHQLQSVRDCYRETIMAVPDYEEQYGETLRENVAAEFTDELATAVVDGDRFTEAVKRLLVVQARESAERREQFLDAIERERSSLTDADERLRETGDTLERAADAAVLQQSFAELVDLERTVRDDEERCERLLAERQREIHEHRHFGRSNCPFLQEYLYDRLDVTFPVLAATLERLRRVRERRRAVIRGISRRY